VGKMSNEEVYDYIDMESMGYAILDGMSADEIKDEKLADLWRIASKALSDIEKYLEMAKEN
jgi:hypothetical protein